MALEPNKTVVHFDVSIKEVNAVLGKESVKTRDEKIPFMNAFISEQMATVKVNDWLLIRITGMIRITHISRGNLLMMAWPISTT